MHQSALMPIFWWNHQQSSSMFCLHSLALNVSGLWCVRKNWSSGQHDSAKIKWLCRNAVRTFDTNVRFVILNTGLSYLDSIIWPGKTGYAYGGQGMWITRRCMGEDREKCLFNPMPCQGKAWMRKGWPLNNGQGIERWYRIPVPNHAG